MDKTVATANYVWVESSWDFISEEECLRIGGHCYMEANVVYPTNPLLYERICKHCGHRQQGREQPVIDWKDID